MKVSILGSIASGKGTQGNRLAEYLHIPSFSVGQILREVSGDDPHYATIKDLLAKGQLVPLEITVALLKSAIERSGSPADYIVDGWGRVIEQVHTFDPFDVVLFLKISEEEAIKRIANRRTCSECGQVYNLVSVPPKDPTKCDTCGGVLVQRSDETESATMQRIAIFNRDTMPAIEHFRSIGKLVEINGEQTPDEVFEEILDKLKVRK